jgi:outer membrane protein TolC
MARRWLRAVLAAVSTGTVLTTGCHTPWEAPAVVTERTLPADFSTLGSFGQRPASPEPAAIQPASFEQPAQPAGEALDLGVALKLAGVENPTVNLARERVQEALAQQLAARSLLLPNVSVGGNLRIHRGPLQRSSGQVREVNSQSLYLGAGAVAVGGGPPAVPGVRLFAHLGNAAYEPLAARQRVTARSSNAQAVQNQILLEVAIAYLELIGAEARIDILRKAEAEAAEIARVTAAFAKAGQGAPSDANRAATTADLIRRQLRQVEGSAGVASARLSRLLNLDPSVQLRSPDGPVEPIRLIPEDADTEHLLAEAVQRRPELLAASAAIQEAQTRVRQEQLRPLLPTLSVGYSAGGFGGGSDVVNSRFSSLSGRSDFDVVAVWTGANLGFGNRARVRGADTVVGQAVAAYDATLNRVRSEVVSAQGDAKAAALQITVARAALAAAEEGFALESARIKQGEGRPIEGLDSFRQLVDARLDYLGAVVAFNVAQFRLFVALGSNPACDVPTGE